MSSVQILVKYRQVVRKTGKTETYNSDELEKLNEFLDQMYAETGDSACLAIKINFMLGLRVGELVALKWEDFADDKHLHIVPRGGEKSGDKPDLRGRTHEDAQRPVYRAYPRRSYIFKWNGAPGMTIFSCGNWKADHGGAAFASLPEEIRPLPGCASQIQP